MQETSLVSLITPTYNRGDFIAAAVDSVIAQTHRHWELLVVDDGSTDDTPAIMRRYADEPRIRYFQQANQGQSVARRRALGEARGQYIGFLDSDNVCLPHRLEVALEALARHSDMDVVYGDIVTIDEHGQETSRKNMKRFSGRITGHMLRDNCVTMNTAIARRHCFDAYLRMTTHRRVADDYDMWLRISAHHHFLYLPEFLACYRVMDDQISSNKTRRFEANEAILRDFLAEHGDTVSAREARTGWAHFHTRKGRYLASCGQRLEALGCYLRAIAHAPLQAVAWRAMARLALGRGGGTGTAS